MNFIQSYSPHRMSRQGHTPIIIVNHIVEGTFQSCLSWFKNPASETSSNFVTSRDGKGAEVIPLKEAAWCNGTQTTNPNGIYYVGRARNKVVKEKWTNANYISVSIEHEGWSSTTKGELTEAQYKKTLELHKYIIKEVQRLYGYKIPINRDHITGHNEIAPKEKPFCPGPLFPYQRLLADLRTWNYGESEVKKMTTEEFIEKIKDAAIDGWKTHEILPSLTIAQAILESASGNSELATKANALFGIKAHTDPSWSNVYKKETQEWSGGKYITITADFKAYKNWDESLKDRLTYLTTRKINGKYIYQSLIGETDYKVAAQKIKDAGYATSPTYPQSLINLIEKYNLQKFDEITKGDEKLNINKIVIAYWNDGDLANALAALNVLGDRAVLTRTLDATEYKWSEVVQIGGTEIKGATKVLKGKNRNETLQKVAEYVKEK